MTDRNPFDLPIPRNLTALMQHLQRLVGRDEYTNFGCGSLSLRKLARFVTKMADRYPLMHTPAQRSRDRKRGLAAVQLVIFPTTDYRAIFHDRAGAYSLMDIRHRQLKFAEALRSDPANARIDWWLVSTDGKGGLADPITEDHRVAKLATKSDEHLTIADYFLANSHKQTPQDITDRRTKRTKTVLKSESTWTWKLDKNLIRQLRAQIEEYSQDLYLGSEPSAHRGGEGLMGLLAAQRSRPLFAGVRTSVIELEKYAREVWKPQISRWRAANPTRSGHHSESAGELISMTELFATRLPKKVLVTVYDKPPLRASDIVI